jgi:hypothetical protein
MPISLQRVLFRKGVRNLLPPIRPGGEVGTLHLTPNTFFRPCDLNKEGMYSLLMFLPIFFEDEDEDE